MSKRKTQTGYAVFPFDEFADMVSVNPSESDKLMRKYAKEHKENQKNNDTTTKKLSHKADS